MPGPLARIAQCVHWVARQRSGLAPSDARTILRQASTVILGVVACVSAALASAGHEIYKSDDWQL
jgi:hypothetical protein